MNLDEIELLEAAVDTMASRHDGPELTEALDGFGWIELLDSAPEVAVPSVFVAQGRLGVWSAAFHDVLAARIEALGADLDPRSVAVVVPPPRAATAGRASGGAVTVDGLCIGARRDLEWLVVAATEPSGAVALFRVASGGVSVVAARGLDPDLHVARVRAHGDGGGAEVLARDAAASAWWSVAEATGRRALSHQICGALGAMLALALVHARERAQFGQLVGTFQAVRHRLAEAYVAVSAAEAAAQAAWDSDDPGLAAATAKLVTSQACEVTVKHCQQVLAGIGFTAEHPYQRLMKRVVVLDRLLGSASDLAPIVGRHLVASGTAPRLVEL